MSDLAPPRFALAAPLAAGVASALLYLSVFLSFVFLIPVQLVFGRSGRRMGMISAVMSTAVIIAVQAATTALAGGFNFAELGIGLIPPLVLMGALAFMNAPFWDGGLAPYRVLAVSAVCALAAIPALLALSHDTNFVGYIEGRLATILAPLKAQAGEGYEASALAASLDAKSLAAASMSTLASSYAAFILVLLGGSWWLGSRAAGPGSPGRRMAPELENYLIPYALVWPFLASWALVLATILLEAPTGIKAAAWNCALVLSLVYAAQGVGIVSKLLKRWNLPRSLRIALAATALLALVTPTAGIVVAVFLPVLGVTEVWIPYRKLKGAGA